MKQPNRSSYSKDKAGKAEAMAMLMAYTLPIRAEFSEEHSNPVNNVWNRIGHWRNLKQVVVLQGKEETVVQYRPLGDSEYEFSIAGQVLKTRLEYRTDSEMDVTLNGRKIFAGVSLNPSGEYRLLINGDEFLLRRADLLIEKTELTENGNGGAGEASNSLFSPIPGKIFKINVKEGDVVKKGDIVVVVDAMKMENNLVAKKDSVVKKIHVELNQMVTGNYLLVELEGLQN